MLVVGHTGARLSRERPGPGRAIIAPHPPPGGDRALEPLVGVEQRLRRAHAGLHAAAIGLDRDFDPIVPTLAERSGVLNLGVEGMMVMGAVAGFAVAFATGSLFLGALAAIAGGTMLALLFGLLKLMGAL